MDLSEPRLQPKSIVSCLQAGCGGSDSSEESAGILTASSFVRNTNNNGSGIRASSSSALDLMLSSELSKLSLQERSNALEDLHCVGNGLEETDEMVEQSLQEFDRILKQGNYPMYDLAAKQNSSYVEDTSYRLMFLRGSLYDVHKAANQMVSHLIQKAKYFGEDTLGRNITIDDLNEDDLAVLLSGTFHIQADKDPTGRAIMYIVAPLLGRWNFEAAVRAHYYVMFNILLPLEEVQTKGLVLVFFSSLAGQDPNSSSSFPSLVEVLKFKAYRNSIPIRYSALHLCLKTGNREDFSPDIIFLKTMLKNVSQYAKVRGRVHYGSHMEKQYSLRSYGIPQGSFPLDSDGNLRSGETLNAWFFKHLSEKGVQDFERFGFSTNGQETHLADDVSMNQEEAEPHMMGVDRIPSAAEVTPSKDAIADKKIPIQPLQHDILLGRGVRLMQHPGNVRFREFLETYQDDYDRAQRNKRRKVSNEVIQALSGQGVRFLERNENGDWVESAIAEAEEKVGQLFRSRRKQRIKKSSK